MRDVSLNVMLDIENIIIVKKKKMGCCSESTAKIEVAFPSPRAMTKPLPLLLPPPAPVPAPAPKPQKVVLSQTDDGLDKYRIIRHEFARTGVGYLDKQFPLSSASLGERTRALVDRWERAKRGHRIFSDSTSGSNVEPSVLCNRYFSSALAAVGSKRLKERMISTDEDVAMGAFCLKMGYGGKERVVIVDSYFPVFESGQWAFSSSIKREELWPLIFEKAYAKLFGSYENVVCGRLDYALAALTGGESFVVALEKDRGNAIWDFIISTLEQNSHLVVAEAPASSDSDSEGKLTGIIPAAGYLLRGAEVYQGERVLKLKHPYGGRGVAWTGPWAAGAWNWTKESKAALRPEQLKRGEFFMGLHDFLLEFKQLDICYLFGTEWASHSLETQWKPESGEQPAGTIRYKNWFSLRVATGCRLFVSVTQGKWTAAAKGDRKIWVTISSDQGEDKGGVTTMHDTGGYSDDGCDTEMLLLEGNNGFGFPLTIDIVVKAMRNLRRREGEETAEVGGVIVKVYCTDKSAELVNNLI